MLFFIFYFLFSSNKFNLVSIEMGQCGLLQDNSSALLKDECYPYSWRHHAPTDLNTFILLYDEIIKKILGSNVLDLNFFTSFAHDRMQEIEKLGRSMNLGTKNISYSRIYFIYEDDSRAKGQICIDLPRLISGKNPSNVKDEINVAYHINLHPGRIHETDQLLFGHLLQADSVIGDIVSNFNDRIHGLDLFNPKVKGVIVDTVTLYDPCTWCAFMIKREQKMKVIKNKFIKLLGGLAGQNFQFAFHFTSKLQCGCRPSIKNANSDLEYKYLSCYGFDA